MLPSLDTKVLTKVGQFACKRVPVGNDHAWLEKGTAAFAKQTLHG
jgi:hypothetical protein